MSEWRKIILIARYTFCEIYRSKIFVNVIILGLGLTAACAVASEFTYGVPQKVALDFGLGMISLSSVAISIFFGVTLLAREIENRTVYMMLSRPLRRTSFLAGKITGLAAVIFANIFILAAMMLALYCFLQGELEGLIFWTLLFCWLEALLMLMIVVFFSLIANNVIAVICSLTLFVAGHAVTDSTIIPFAKDNPLILSLLKFYHWFFPDFSKLNLKLYVLYEQPISLSYLITAAGYAIVYLGILGILSAYIFQRKNLD